MGNIFDLDSPSIVAGCTRRVPGPVRRLNAFRDPSCALALCWQPPAGGTFITGYRIERTREGREYELVGETKRTAFFVRHQGFDEPWFYRVTAFNARGSGGFRLVWLFRESSKGSILLRPIAAIPGLRMEIWE